MNFPKELLDLAVQLVKLKRQQADIQLKYIQTSKNTSIEEEAHIYLLYLSYEREVSTLQNEFDEKFNHTFINLGV